MPNLSARRRATAFTAAYGVALTVLSSLAAGVIACVSRGSAPARPITWRVVDSAWIAPWDEVTDSVLVYRVAITDGVATETVTDVLGPWPVVVDDSTVVGLRARRADPGRELFRSRLHPRAVTALPLPADLQADFTDVAVSPHGDYLAYVGSDSLAAPYAVVRRFPDGPIVVRGPTASGCDCDVDLNHARWVSADSFEIAVVDRVAGAGWQVVAGRASAGRSRVAAADSEPTWHERRTP